jgi:hypothetical protein
MRCCNLLYNFNILTIQQDIIVHNSLDLLQDPAASFLYVRFLFPALLHLPQCAIVRLSYSESECGLDEIMDGFGSAQRALGLEQDMYSQ